jgi:acetolactate synthase-1/2/3 large subunit
LRGGHLIAKILKREGIEFVTGFPRNALHEMLAEEGIRLIKFRTERVAINAADGFTRSSFCDRHGISVVQYGPGIENSFGGVAHAFADSVPILLLPAGYERRRKVVPNFDALRNYREVTKWVDEVNFIDRAPEMFRRAFTYLKDGRPGPVMLVLPTDIITEEASGVDDNFEYTPVKRSRSQGDPADVREAAKLLIAAKCPVIRAGGGVLYAKAWDELKELAELLSIPVFTTLNGKSAFPESHPLALGAGGQSRPDMVMHFLRKTDLVFAVGSSCTEEAFTTPLRPGCPIIQSTIDERDINKDYPVTQAIMGDAKLILRQLIEEIKQQGVKSRERNNERIKEIKAVKNEWLKKWMPKLTSSEKPISPYRVIRDLQKALDEKNTIVTHDSGSLREQMLPFYEANTPGSYLGWGKSTTMGQSLGFALGAKIAWPEKTVLHVIGDGSFGMVGMDFETGVRENIPIITVVLNNGKLGGYDNYFPIASKRFNLNIVSGDYTKIAEGLGAGYVEKITEPEEIIPAVKRAKKANDEGKPVLLEIFTEQDLDFSSFPTKW